MVSMMVSPRLWKDTIRALPFQRFTSFRVSSGVSDSTSIPGQACPSNLSSLAFKLRLLLAVRLDAQVWEKLVPLALVGRSAHFFKGYVDNYLQPGQFACEVLGTFVPFRLFGQNMGDVVNRVAGVSYRQRHLGKVERCLKRIAHADTFVGQ